MSGRVVCDASAVVAVLLDGGADGWWAAEALSGSVLAAPALLHFEVGNIIRRHELGGLIGSDQAVQAHEDLIDLDVEAWPYELVARRVWQLRHNLSAYDASYVAVAEATESTLVTLDRRMAGAPGVTCTVLCPPDT